MHSTRALLSGAILTFLIHPSTQLAHSQTASPPSLTPSQSQSGQNPPSVPTFQATTSLVFLDVTVLDKKGHIVASGLTKDDFSITEDKRPQKIFSFESPETHVPDKHASPSDDQTPDGNAPITIFVLDQLNSNLDDFAFYRDQMQKYLDAQPSRLPAPSELMLLGNRSLELVQGYTRNRADLVFALKHIPNALPYKMGANWNSDRALQSIQALQQISLQSKGVTGRKNIIWLGHGPPGMNTNFMNDNSIDKMEQFVHQTTNMLVDARISLFVLFPGLKTREITVSLAAQEADSALGLDPFAGDINFGVFVNETGGKLFHNQNDVDDQIRQSQRQGGEYYTLTYHPAQSADSREDGKFRRVRVTLRNPNLIAVTKGGYYAPDEKNPLDPEKQTILNVSQAVQSSIPYTGLAIKVDTLVRHPDSRTAEVTVIVQSKNIQWQSTEDGKSNTNLILAAVCLSSTRQVLASKLQGIAFSATTQDQTALAHQSLRIPITLRLPKGTQTLRIAAQTEDGGRIGATDLDRKTIESAPATSAPEPQLASRPASHTP